MPDAGRPYWQAFQVLDQQRGSGGGMSGTANPIRYTDILAYAAAEDLPSHETVTIVQMMDDAYFAFHAALRAKMAAAQAKGAA